jgi:DNA polymerase-4
VRWSRIVFHVDMDAFYASIEQRDDPSLKGKPVIVGGLGNRGVVSTASYEARKFGVRSAMPMFEARRRAPNAVYLSGRMKVYSAVSKQLMAILADYSPEVEPLSLDEAFLDMSGTEELLGPPAEVGARLLDEIEEKLGVTASVGIAPNKYIAKVASDMNKPRGVTMCRPGQERAFLAPLPIERIWGVGPKTAPRLHAYGLRTIGDVAGRSLEELKGQLGNFGEHIWRLANGQDVRSVKRERASKSMGAERTLSRNITGRDAVYDVLLPLCDEVAARLRKHEYRAAGVRLKVKYANFQQHTRQLKLDEPVQDSASLAEALEELYTRVDLDRPMRLVGMAAFDLVPAANYVQPGLFARKPRAREPAEVDHKRRARSERLERTLDQVKAKFGDKAVGRASGRAVASMTPSDHVVDEPWARED